MHICRSGKPRLLWFTLAIVAQCVLASAAFAITEFSDGISPGAHPGMIVVGADGNLWFTEANGIGRITPDGVVTEFQTGITWSPFYLTRGPDGNVWFTEVQYAADRTIEATKIAKITPDGVVTEYDAPRIAYEITEGWDDNLWFLGGTTGFGKITTDGDVQDVLVPQAIAASLSTPNHLTRGPDGNVWFSQYFDEAIGKITPDGAIQIYRVGSHSSFGHASSSIVAGPDGNLWETLTGANEIARVVPDGSSTVYTVGAPGVGGGLPGGQRAPRDNLGLIVAGALGELWFTEYPASSNGAGTTVRIAKITTDGTITHYNFGLSPGGMVFGPDGNLWVTEPSLDRIARITTAGIESALNVIPTLSQAALLLLIGLTLIAGSAVLR